MQSRKAKKDNRKILEREPRQYSKAYHRYTYSARQYVSETGRTSYPTRYDNTPAKPETGYSKWRSARQPLKPRKEAETTFSRYSTQSATRAKNQNSEAVGLKGDRQTNWRTEPRSTSSTSTSTRKETSKKRKDSQETIRIEVNKHDKEH